MDEQYEARAFVAYTCMQEGKQQSNAKFRGGLAQLGEHLLCKQGVVGSIPSSSTKPLMKKLEVSAYIKCVFISSFYKLD